MNVITLPNVIPQRVFGDIDSRIDFGVGFEISKAPTKKYVINRETGEYLDTVGISFKCASHPEFFRGVQGCMIEEMTGQDLEGVTIKYRASRNNAWAMMDCTLPSMHCIVPSLTMLPMQMSVMALRFATQAMIPPVCQCGKENMR